MAMNWCGAGSNRGNSCGSWMEPKREALRVRLLGSAVGVAALGVVGASPASFATSFPDCNQAGLSAETQQLCDAIEDLEGRDKYKAIVRERLRRTNQPPVADLKLERVQPDRVDLHALDATDEDGFPHVYYFRLEDAATGEVVAGPITTREPVASLRLNGKRPERVRAFVVVEDDERALDEAELEVDLPPLCGNNANVSCFPQGGAPEITTCYPTSVNFTTFELLDAARRCNADITSSTPVVFAASGAAGGRGANVWPADGGPGGAGGLAALGTTLEHLDEEFPNATYCWGRGSAGGHTDTYSGAGGASTILRTCDNFSQTETTGVLLIAGGGGGGVAINGPGGGDGGVAYSGTDGPCPGSCILSTVPAGQRGGGPGSSPGNGGGSGTGGGKGGQCDYSEADGNDGIGGAGGYVPGFGTAYWGGSDPLVDVDANVGQGGGDCDASGGGGYGGGGAGNGGGGGGSFAAQSTLNNIDSSQWSRSEGGGWIYILFKPQS